VASERPFDQEQTDLVFSELVSQPAAPIANTWPHAVQVLGTTAMWLGFAGWVAYLVLR
jgi:hypothetical protein